MRDNFCCVYCGSRAPIAVLEVDHRIPRASGGSDDDDNLVTACWSCNRGKFNIPPPVIGVQWRVTHQGVECVDRSYFIDKKRLFEMRRDTGDLYDWPIHMAEKPWVDLDEFLAAWQIAVALHARELRKTLDINILTKTLRTAREVRRQHCEYDAKARELFPEKFDGRLQLWSYREMCTVRDAIDAANKKAAQVSPGGQ